MKRINAVFLLVLAMFFFSFIGVFSRLSGKDPFSVSFYRAVFSMMIFFGIYVGRVPKVGMIEKIRNLRLSREKAKIILPYGVSVSVTILTFICAYLYTTMANTILLHYLVPLYVLLGSFAVTGEKVSPSSIIGFLAGLLGVCLITGFDIIKGVSSQALLGNFLAFVSGISYAGIILWTRKARLVNIDIIYFVFWGWAITALFCLPFAFLFGEFHLSFQAFLFLLGLAILATVLPFIISNIAIKYLSAQASSVIAYSEAVFVMIWGALFYKEIVTQVTLIGAGCIFFSILIITKSSFSSKQHITISGA